MALAGAAVSAARRRYSLSGKLLSSRNLAVAGRLNLDVMNNDIQEQVVQQIMGPMDWQSAVTP